MTTIRLYLDENVSHALARVLRARGFDVVAVSEVNRLGYADIEQLNFAVSANRTLFTHDIADYSELANQFAAKVQSHFGIVVSNQMPFGELLRRLLNLLHTRTAEDMLNRFDWLQNYK